MVYLLPLLSYLAGWKSVSAPFPPSNPDTIPLEKPPLRRAAKTRVTSLNSIGWLIGSQWSCCGAVLMCSNRLVFVSIEFWVVCSFLRLAKDIPNRMTLALSKREPTSVAAMILAMSSVNEERMWQKERFISYRFCRSTKRLLLERHLSSYPGRTGGRTDERTGGRSQQNNSKTVRDRIYVSMGS